jgi:hypothetical protein
VTSGLAAGRLPASPEMLGALAHLAASALFDLDERWLAAAS